MRLLSIALVLVIVGPWSGEASEPQDRPLAEQVEEALRAAEVAYQEGQVETGSRLAREALRLAVSLEPAILRPPANLNERKARADLLLNLGDAALHEGWYDTARRFLETSLELYRQTSGQQEPKQADVLLALAALDARTGRSEQWRSSVEQALEIRVDTYGENHPKVAYIWGLLGTKAETDGDLGAAKKYFRRALESLESSQSSTARDLGFAYLDLARVLKAAGEPMKAATLQRKGAEILSHNRP